MEILQTLYQERIDSLAQTFLRLLQQLETTVSPFSQPMLAPYRIEYLEHIIVSTLNNEREKFISTLSQQISELQSQGNKRSSYSTKQSSHEGCSTSTCSRQSIYEKDFSELQLKSPKLSQKCQRMTQKNPHYLEQTYLDGESSLFDDNTSKKKRRNRKESISQTSIKLQTVLKSRYEVEEKEDEEEDKFQFKYLKLNQNKNKRY